MHGTSGLKPMERAAREAKSDSCSGPLLLVGLHDGPLRPERAETHSLLCGDSLPALLAGADV